LRPLFPLPDIKLRQREMRQRELKVREQATPNVNSFCALLLTMTINQTTIFSRSSLGQLCAQRSQLRPRTPDPPFSVWNSQLFSTGLNCKSTEHNQGQVNVRAVVKAGPPAAFYAQKRSANYIQMNQCFSMTTQMRPKALLVVSMSILGVLNRTRGCMTHSKLQNLP
jgi:hypothetical protein